MKLGNFGNDIVRRTRIAMRDHGGHPYGAWSTGEKLAVALVLGDNAYIKKMGYTKKEALTRVQGGTPERITTTWLRTVRAEATISSEEDN